MASLEKPTSVGVKLLFSGEKFFDETLDFRAHNDINRKVLNCFQILSVAMQVITSRQRSRANYVFCLSRSALSSYQY